LSGVEWFSTLDLNSGYWQVQLDESSKEKTAFSTGHGLWQFKVMPFGLCNGPATFERLMELVLAGLPLHVHSTCVPWRYPVPGQSFSHELTNLQKVFERLRTAKLNLSPKKCPILFILFTSVPLQCPSVGQQNLRMFSKDWKCPWHSLQAVRILLSI